ncbi:MAG: tRNA adenosine deaminase-associated protein [Actinobacteria bacterium]|nr:tRNA adenosine deaminase-associated protein [Actinomycetota bacterium]
MEDNAVDSAIIAWREEGMWQVESLTPRSSESLDSIINALRSQPGEGGSLALVSVAEEFFLIVRVFGAEPRVLVSDELASLDWPLAAQALVLLEMDLPDEDDDDDEEGVPAGDLAILADLGVSADEIDLLCGDLELYPEEALSTIASRIGFGDQYSAATSSLG